jgi:ppGpp synthetase/RelA/SpoT-type nucleotidyltranferase
MARGPSHKVAVPASPVEVRAFLDGCRGRFIDALQNVRVVVDALRASRPALSCIYKIYTRGDLQGGEQLKSSRKVRLKFNDFNLARDAREASLYDVPDIIGLTVVVSYPSDINVVAAALDDAIEAKDLSLPGWSASVPPARSGAIVSRFGRPIESGGYFACHFNVQLPGLGPRPICEIQIKTILHDAWGAKTHDLTYKPSGRTDRDMRRSFDLLGDMLANLDAQSDALRQGIERTSSIREGKRAGVRIWSLDHPLRGAVEAEQDPQLKAGYRRLHDRISGIGPHSPMAEVNEIFRRLLDLFESAPRVTAFMLCLLAVRVGRRELYRHVQDALAAWEDRLSDDLQKLRVRLLAALAAFSGGDVSEAIDLAEEAVAAAEAAVAAPQDSDRKHRAERLSAALFSSLAYYHADRIGSYEGEKRGSRALAVRALERSRRLYSALQLPDTGLETADADIKAAFANGDTGQAAFAALDNEAFVLIQTAESEGEVRYALSRLQFVHNEMKEGAASDALLNYHEYCARMRLAELEAAEA